MNRREFVQAGLATAAVAATAVSAEAETATATEKGTTGAHAGKMNVLYLFSDQHRECSLPGKPYCQVEAPTLDKFRRENFAMENCISNYPLCTPYRAILMTGRYPQQTGVMMNGSTLAPDAHSLGNTFKNAGYHTGYVGKWHLEDFKEEVFVPEGPRRQGFEDWHAWAATGKHYGAWTYDPKTGAKIQPQGWNATLMTDDALRFVKAQPGRRKVDDRPWMLVVSWNPPHPAFDPPADDAALYPKDKLEFRPNLAKPTPRDVGFSGWIADEEKLRAALEGYYGGITGIDKEVARLLAGLDETGQAGNTIVIYTSDHGEMMGSHGRGNKEVPFEESCHVPFFVRVPGGAGAGGAGAGGTGAGSSKALFAAVDIFPTLCGLAGIAVPATCAGRDMSGVMRGEAAPVEKNVILMANRGGGFVFQDPTPYYRGLRTPTHTYCVTEDGRWILYDNVADPYQKNNLVNDASQKSLMDKLDAEIIAWQTAVGDTFQFRNVLGSVSAFPD